MSRHLQVVAVCVLWALVLIALAGTIAHSPTPRGNGIAPVPAGPHLKLWSRLLGVLFVTAVAMTAWVSS